MSNLATEANYEVIVDYRGHHATNVTKIAFTELAKKVGPRLRDLATGAASYFFGQLCTVQ